MSSSSRLVVRLSPGSGFWRVLLVGAMAALLVLSLLPSSDDLPTTGWDKANHLLGFAALGWLGHRSWPRQWGMTLFGLLAYGVLIECLQLITPDRMAELSDVVADGIGLAFGAAISASSTARCGT